MFVCYFAALAALGDRMKNSKGLLFLAVVAFLMDGLSILFGGSASLTLEIIILVSCSAICGTIEDSK